MNAKNEIRINFKNYYHLNIGKDLRNYMLAIKYMEQKNNKKP